MSKRKDLHKIIGADESGIYALQARVGKGRTASAIYTLQYLNEDLKLIREADLSLLEQDKHLKYKFTVQLEDRLYVFLTHRNKELGEEALYAREIDKSTLKAKGTLQKVATLSNERNDGYFMHALSEDRSKLMISYASASGRQHRQEFDLYVLDADLSTLWFKEACLPYQDNIFRTEQYKVDNKGNVYLLNLLFEDKRLGKRDGYPDYKYHLVSYKKGGSEVEEYAIRLAGKFLTDMQIVVNEQQDVIGGGFYADMDSYEVEGSYFFTIDGRSHEVVSNSVKEFTKDLVNHTIPASHLGRNSRRSSGTIRQNGFTLNEILLREDGSAVLIGEQFLVSSRTDLRSNRLGSRTKTSYYYDYSDIIMVDADPEGQINWTGKISKHQHSHNDAGRFSSYHLKMLQGNLYFVYNQQAAAGSGKGEKDCGRLSETVLVKVDRDGRQHQQKIEDLEHTDVLLMPVTGLQAGKNGLVFLGGGKRSNRFIKVGIKPEEILTSKHEQE